MSDILLPSGVHCSLRYDLRPGDLGAILAMHGKLYQLECNYDLTFEGYVAQTLGHFARPHDDKKQRVWIVEREDRLVACAGVLRHAHRVAQLRWFLVVPEMRGNGLGTRLLQEALRFARSAGYSSMFLETVAELPAALRLYRSMGFVKTAEQPRTMWGRAVTEQRYELQL
jgi:GNAT superfamily N-acetyltransferase